MLNKRDNKRLFALMLGLALIFIFNPASAEQLAAAKSPEVPANLNLNKMLYEKFCASCHGVDLKGTKKGPPFLHRVYHPGHHGDGSFFRAAKNGARAHHWKFGDMKPVPETNDSIIASIVKYVRYIQKQAGLF
tara:strand:+ start:2859 stop:3257 length:399 start_codon:yes stop_codon:yes gene_type:complete